MTLRLANWADLPFVRYANLAWLQEQEVQGGPLLVSAHNISIHVELFRSWMTGTAKGFGVVAEGGGGPCGLALVGQEATKPRWQTRVPYHQTCTVWLVWVKPEFRQQGLGLRMLHWAVQPGKELGFNQVFCSTLQVNFAGAGLAKAFGIQPVETLYQIDV